MSKPILCGGLNQETQEIDPKIHEMIRKLQPKIEEKFGKKLDKCKVVKLRQQLVAGINYFIKCDIGNNQYLHLRVFEPLPCEKVEKEPELIAIHSEIKKLEDPLDYF